MTRVLITGGAGFIGSHAIEFVLRQTGWDVVVLDGLTYAGDATMLTRLPSFDAERVTQVWHDLRAPIGENTDRRIGPVDIVWHFAADSHVDRSISEPAPFFMGNAAATINMLEWARKRAMQGRGVSQFIQVSTDEVYGPSDGETLHREWSSIVPSNPYSASKAAQEAAAIAYWRTYGVPLFITNTMNNIGERQNIEKYVPMVISKILRGEVIEVHSHFGEDGWESGSRCWLYAEDHADALLFLSYIDPKLYPEAERPGRFNVTGSLMSNHDIATEIARILDMEAHLKPVDAHSSRPGHDLHYGLDGALMEDLGWTPPTDLKHALEKTVDWYLRNKEMGA